MENEKYMNIKNLSQLKKILVKGKKYRVIKHCIRDEYSGQLRYINIKQTNGMYSKIVDDPDCKVSNCNHGKGIWSDFGKATNWVFKDNLCTFFDKYYINEKEKVVEIFTIGVLDI